MMKSVFVVRGFDPHRYQGFATVLSVHASENEAESEVARRSALEESDDTWEGMDYYVSEHDLLP